MIKVIELKLLVDTHEGKSFAHCLGTQAFIKELAKNPHIVLDAELNDLGEVIPELEDALMNETYIKGQAFYPSARLRLVGDGVIVESENYWSNEYGWSSRDLAYRFLPLKSKVPNLCIGPKNEVIVEI